MIILLLFAFLGGIATILSPCILPVLPIILSGSLTGGKRRPLGIITGFTTGFTFFTLFLSTLVEHTGISADALRNLSVLIILGFGLSMLFPAVQFLVEKFFSKFTAKIQPKTANQQDGFIGGILMGLSLGLIWTPCVGPILASVIALSITGTITTHTLLITTAYSLGTGIPLLIITYGGNRLLQKTPWLVKNAQGIQKVFAILMILTAIGVFLNIDRKFQTYILEKFPSYGQGLTQFEDNQKVQEELNKLQPNASQNNKIGEPMDKVLNE